MVHMLAYHNVVTIPDNNLRGHRNGANKHRSDGRA
jgi:hypothetical protein